MRQIPAKGDFKNKLNVKTTLASESINKMLFYLMRTTLKNTISEE